jgi:hypothetical protein
MRAACWLAPNLSPESRTHNGLNGASLRAIIPGHDVGWQSGNRRESITIRQ